MRVVYHPKVQKDVNGILKYYEGVSPNLADEFWAELRRFLEWIGENPDHSHPVERDFRRVNLQRFPYHILFRRLPMSIWIIVVRHNKRQPRVGLSRR
jgi:toxin ParE1/3/4